MTLALPPIFVAMTVVIMLDATLGFLGIGVPLAEPSLGMMIAMFVGINLFADWLR